MNGSWATGFVTWTCRCIGTPSWLASSRKRQSLGDAEAARRHPRGITAAWVAGCDGAHSSVRELSGITFPGAPYEHVFFVADAEVTGSMVPDEVNVYLWREGFHLFFPMRGQDHWRIVGILPPDLRGKDDVNFDAVIPSLRSEAGTGLSFKSCTWFSTYRIHHRSALRFRDRRCFLLGDAAHIHSPVGAQGMNTGLQDAYNLAWKLALVVQGRADVALLDSYEEERIPIARRLLHTTDRAFRLVVSHSRLAGLLRTQYSRGSQRSRWECEDPGSGVSRRFPDRHSLPEQPAVEIPQPAPDHAPHAGDRFPWLRLKLRGRPHRGLVREARRHPTDADSDWTGTSSRGIAAPGRPALHICRSDRCHQ